MENREGKGKMEKERDWEEGCGWFGVQGWSLRVTRRLCGCGSFGCLLVGKLRQEAGSPRGRGYMVLPTAAPCAWGLSLQPGGVQPLLAWGHPQRCGYLGGHPTLQALLLPSTTTAAPRPRQHRDHAGTATTPAPRSRSPPPPLGILQAFNCRKHRLIKQR